MAETAADRVVRLLALVTYLQDRPGAPVAQVAEHFGVSTAQVLQDVNTLWVSGTPGYMPDDLIDFSADDRDRGILTLTDARGMSRPLRLGAQEAISLLTALRSLRATPGLEDDEGLLSTIDKLATAAGSAAAAAEAVQITGPASDDGHVRAVLAQLRRALAEDSMVHLRYVSVADDVTERDVDPLQLLTDGRHWFLVAWCHRAGAVRQFRLDRILDQHNLHLPAHDHPEVTAARTTEPELSGAPWHARVHLQSRARWVAEQYPATALAEQADGSFVVELPVLDPAWLHRLLLGLGDALISVSPPELAGPLRARAAAAVRAYAENEHARAEPVD